jgi:effector-binding domain-containing protein
VKEIPITSVAYSRYQGPSYPDEFSLRYTKLNNLIEKNKLHITGTMMAVYYDDYRNYDYMNADIEVCVTVAEQEGNSDIIRKFGGFLAAVTMHYGSYKTMNQTYAKALEWLDRNGFVYVGGAIENYIIDVITSIDENDFVTEIIIPIAEFHK